MSLQSPIIVTSRTINIPPDQVFTVHHLESGVSPNRLDHVKLKFEVIGQDIGYGDRLRLTLGTGDATIVCEGVVRDSVSLDLVSVEVHLGVTKISADDLDELCAAY